ncbi:MAG: flavodoxin family protein [Parasporobacterium sp.]|nr:flavodoxin family protein [Parasporobacterium sp.]
MKILGLNCGRNMGNSEILLKEALMAAAELGVEYEMIRLHDMNIKPCIGCNGCILSASRGGTGDCVALHDDDMDFFREKFLECDGIIISAPAFNNTAPGLFRLLGDRCGPAFDREMKRYAQARGANIDQRWYKPRVAAWIMVGGGPMSHLHTGLPLMFHFSKSVQARQVDRMAAPLCPAPGQVLMHPDYIERAAQLGRNLVSQMGKPENEVEWLGGDDYVCPHCRSTMLVIGQNNECRCATCGKPGHLAVDPEGHVIMEFDPDVIAVDDPEYRIKHFDSIIQRHEDFKEYIRENKEKFDRYRNFGTFTLPPR